MAPYPGDYNNNSDCVDIDGGDTISAGDVRSASGVV